MIRIRSILLTILTLGLSGCQYALLNPKGMIAADEKQLMITAILLMCIVVVPVILLSFIFSWRYRANNKCTYTPEWSHSTLLEIICWSVPCIIIAILGTLTWQSSYRLDPYKPLTVNSTVKPLTIQAISLEWKWLFIYPEQNIATINFVQFPINTPVQFLVSAEGPMNSFQILQLAGQIYAMAGMQTKLHLITNTVGNYRGISANFTGDGFSDMTFTARASSKTEFDAWVNQVKHSPDQLTMATYHQLIKPSKHQAIHTFSSADQTIFNMAVMQSMMPMNMDNKPINHHVG